MNDLISRQNLIDELREIQPDLDLLASMCIDEIIEKFIKKQPTAHNLKTVVTENRGWIPCSERLPDDGKDVLVWFEYYRYGSYNRLSQTIGISYTYMEKWSGFINGSSGWSQLRIIAWQPLPDPYKEEKHE